MCDPLVTVVVPIYNVELYLDQCVESILNQSYTNLEIILVDDGSTDNSASMCDAYCLREDRIKVIHKKNGGLSSARNRGIDVATGTYIIFVDSDDYLHPCMVEKMIKTAMLHDSSIVCCDYTSSNFPSSEMNDVEILDNSLAICRLFDDSAFKCYAWNKIYKKDLFDTIRYPHGKLFEDIPVTYDLFKKTDKIVYLKNKLYYYRIREGSITKSKFTAGNRDLLEAINYVIDDACSAGIASSKLWLGYMSYYLNYVKKGFAVGIDIADDYSKIIKIVRKNYKSIISNNNISIKKRIQLIMIGVCPQLYKKIYVTLNK